MLRFVLGAAALAAVAGSASAQFQYCIDFEQDALGNAIVEGQLIDNEYVAWGATFVANPLDTGPSDGWASNTDMTVTSDPFNVGGGYLPAYGNIMHTFDGWLAEDDDPNFAVVFNQPISAIEVGFTGDSSGLSEVGVFDGNGNFIDSVLATGNVNLKVATLTGLNTAEVGVILPGSFGDWVGIVYIKYTFVPTPSTAALLGLGVLAGARRRR